MESSLGKFHQRMKSVTIFIMIVTVILTIFPDQRYAEQVSESLLERKRVLPVSGWETHAHLERQQLRRTRTDYAGTALITTVTAIQT